MMKLDFQQKNIVFIAISLLICIAIFIQVIFGSCQEIEFLKWEVVLLNITSVMSVYILTKNFLHPYIVFLETFFLFLCSRIVLDIMGFNTFAETSFFSQYEFSVMIQIKILLILGIALGFLNLGFFFSNVFHRESPIMYINVNLKLKKFSLFLMYISIVPSIIAYYQIINQVLDHGYVYIYTENFEKPMLMSFVTVFQVGYYTFLASIPSKKIFLRYTLLYSILLSMTLLVGARSLFAVNFLLFLVYYHTYIKKIKFKRIVVITFIIVFLLQFISWFRMSSMDVSNFELDNEFLFHFLREQGVSVTVIGYTEQFKDEISSGGLNYILYPFRRYIDQKMNDGKRDLDENINTSLADKISYLANSKMYFAGLGTGNSFVAELYADGGILFVAMGCSILGWMINYTFIKLKNHYLGVISLCYLWSGLFFMPRGTYFGNILDMTKGLLFVAIFYPIFNKITKLKYK